MKLQPHQRVTLRQHQRLAQVQQRAVAFLAQPGGDLARDLAELASANPFLRLSGGPPAAPPVDRDEMAQAAEQGPGLIQHVLTHLPHLLPDRRDHDLALALTEGLDASGYLVDDPARIAARLRRPVAEVERVLAALQRIEPAGLFARSLAECLRLQLVAEGLFTPLWQAVLQDLPLVAEGRQALLAQRLGIDGRMLDAMLRQLRGLNPRPASGFSHSPTPSRIPDLLASRGPTGWDLALNPESLPNASMRPIPEGGDARAHRAARQVVTALDLRNRAMLSVARLIVTHQAEALDRGAVALRPLTRRALATEAGLHETTVGRILRHASLLADGRILPLADLVAREGPAPGLTRPAVLALIRERLAEGPATDAALADWLAARGAGITRRRIAKYRAEAQLPARRGRPAKSG
ncbi:hypothetical protein E7811_15805 [Aliigemmobacter aestuarii]|uniref:RNA polymerase sigma-54 factor n=1 Tax=Aliigemmobacter aestuarii TaxID=1445661 RepID=A0A4S3MJG2_9RHOB|nr:hypothetical protein [Gemmobacter aestuarii]THD81388.1 hypothetical protein E7811_15805 [Gemmobacter aestuarii]